MRRALRLGGTRCRGAGGRAWGQCARRWRGAVVPLRIPRGAARPTPRRLGRGATPPRRRPRRSARATDRARRPTATTRASRGLSTPTGRNAAMAQGRYLRTKQGETGWQRSRRLRPPPPATAGGLPRQALHHLLEVRTTGAERLQLTRAERARVRLVLHGREVGLNPLAGHVELPLVHSALFYLGRGGFLLELPDLLRQRVGLRIELVHLHQDSRHGGHGPARLVGGDRIGLCVVLGKSELRAKPTKLRRVSLLLCNGHLLR